MHNLAHRSRASVGRTDGDGRDRRQREGRHLPPDADRSRPPGARLVPGALRGARHDGDGRRHGRDVRAPAGPARTTFRRSRSAAISTRSRPAASSTACSACSARSKRCARWSRPATRPTRRSRSSTGPTRKARASRRRCVASGVFAGAFTRDWAVARDRPRRRHVRRRRWTRIGYRGDGDVRRSIRSSAFFELHIEQGPMLEAEDKEIGVVTGVQGMRWYEVTVTGQDAHTGATPMHLRKNALVGAARLVERIDADRAGACAARGRQRRPDRGEAEFAQRRAGRGVLHRRPAPSRRRRCSTRWSRCWSRRWREICDPLGLERRR